MSLLEAIFKSLVWEKRLSGFRSIRGVKNLNFTTFAPFLAESIFHSNFKKVQPHLS